MMLPASLSQNRTAAENVTREAVYDPPTGKRPPHESIELTKQTLFGIIRSLKRGRSAVIKDEASLVVDPVLFVS